jgi:hypothetical protein
MRTVILTLGRLPKALDLARSFAANGWRVVVAEPFRRHLTGASRAVALSRQVTAPSVSRARYLDDLARVAREEGAELVVPVSEEAVHAAFVRDRLGEGVRLFAMPPETVVRLHDKHAFALAAAAMGLDVPETHALGSPEAQALARRSPVVVKLVHACGGRGMVRLKAGETLPDADRSRPAIVQRLVAGQEFSTCSIAHDGRVQSTVVYRGVLRSGAVAVIFERVDHPAIAAWVERFVAATGWTGFVSFDFIVDADGRPFAIECNPRTTSGLHFWRNEDIARAVADPGFAPRFRPERRLQQFYATLTESRSAMKRGEPSLPILRALAATRDVSWTARDPMPFLTMIWTAWPIIRAARQRNVPFGEVATLDVGWTDEPNAAPAAP